MVVEKKPAGFHKYKKYATETPNVYLINWNDDVYDRHKRKKTASCKLFRNLYIKLKIITTNKLSKSIKPSYRVISNKKISFKNNENI